MSWFGHRARPPHRTPVTWAVAALFVLALAPAAHAGAEGPTVSGSVSGSLEQGGRLTIRISAVDSLGWRNLHRLDVQLTVGGGVADELSFDIESNVVTLNGLRVPVGTGATGMGAYVRLAGSDVIVTTGGARLEFRIGLEVLKPIPEDARFRLTAEDDFGATATVTRSANVGGRGEDGLPWGSVMVAVAVALFVGAFLGNLFASRRRPAARPSIYSTIQRRIEEERQEAGSSAKPPP